MPKLSLRQAEDKILDAYEKANVASVKSVIDHMKAGSDPHSHEAATNAHREFFDTVRDVLKTLTEE